MCTRKLRHSGCLTCVSGPGCSAHGGRGHPALVQHFNRFPPSSSATQFLPASFQPPSQRGPSRCTCFKAYHLQQICMGKYVKRCRLVGQRMCTVPTVKNIQARASSASHHSSSSTPFCPRAHRPGWTPATVKRFHSDPHHDGQVVTLAGSCPHCGHLCTQRRLNFSPQLDHPFWRARHHHIRQGYTIYFCDMGLIMWPPSDQSRANYSLSSPGQRYVRTFPPPA